MENISYLVKGENGLRFLFTGDRDGELFLDLDLSRDACENVLLFSIDNNSDFLLSL